MIDYHINPNLKNLPLFYHKICKRLLFGRSAYSVSEHVHPNQARDEIHIEREYLDLKDLHIHRWGKDSGVIDPVLRFPKGGLIFVRYRTS